MDDLDANISRWAAAINDALPKLEAFAKRMDEIPDDEVPPIFLEVLKASRDAKEVVTALQQLPGLNPGSHNDTNISNWTAAINKALPELEEFAKRMDEIPDDEVPPIFLEVLGASRDAKKTAQALQQLRGLVSGSHGALQPPAVPGHTTGGPLPPA